MVSGTPSAAVVALGPEFERLRVDFLSLAPLDVCEGTLELWLLIASLLLRVELMCPSRLKVGCMT